jgi:hypothetical protein
VLQHVLHCAAALEFVSERVSLHSQGAARQLDESAVRGRLHPQRHRDAEHPFTTDDAYFSERLIFHDD